MSAAPTQAAPSERFTPDGEVAAKLGVSLEAVALVRSSEVIDLHLESYIPPRLWGYDLARRHDRHWLGGRFFGHLDFPRALDGGLTGGMWSIATNILRGARGRRRALAANVRGLRGALERYDGIRVVRTFSEWERARRDGQHGAMIAVQGGNALEAVPMGAPLRDGPPTPAGDLSGGSADQASADRHFAPLAMEDASELDDIVRVTVMHLSSSAFGTTSSPARLGGGGLTAAGKAFVERLDAARIFVDLAHVDREGFWDAVDAHDRTLPLIVTHTGVTGVKPHWRNIDDDQIRAIAESGGVVGVMFEPGFLRAKGMANDAEMVIAHLEHVIRVGGEDAAALGSDYDGFIIPPPDLRDGFAAYFRLVQRMLDAGWKEARIRKVLGTSFLRSFAALRP